MPHLDWPFEFMDQCLRPGTSVSGPVEVFANYEDGPDLRASASFTTDDPNHPKVVLKINRFPFLSGSLDAHRRVFQAAPGLVPDIIGFEVLPEGSHLLLDWFEGTPVKNTSEIIAAARALADVQSRVTKHLSDAEMVTIDAAQIPQIFDDCLAIIEKNFESAWASDRGGKMRAAMGFDGKYVLDRLEPLRHKIAEWSKHLAASTIPHSIDHGDFHAGNAIVRPDGGILIFDWENACVAHPFLSIEKYLTSAWAHDAGASGGPWGYTRSTPTQNLVREAYLSAWGTPDLQELFDIAMPLAVIKEMHHEIQWAVACNWQHENPQWTAQLIRRLFEHRTLL